MDFNIGKHIQSLYSNLLEQNPQSIWQLSLAFQHEEDDYNLIFDVYLHLVAHSAVSAQCIKDMYVCVYIYIYHGLSLPSI